MTYLIVTVVVLISVALTPRKNRNIPSYFFVYEETREHTSSIDYKDAIIEENEHTNYGFTK